MTIIESQIRQVQSQLLAVNRAMDRLDRNPRRTQAQEQRLVNRMRELSTERARLEALS